MRANDGYTFKGGPQGQCQDRALKSQGKAKIKDSRCVEDKDMASRIPTLSTALVLTTKVEMTKRKNIRNLTLKMTLVKIEKTKI